MSETVRVLGIAGSLRKGSYNRGLLRAAATLLPPGMTLETAEIGAIPPYDGDVQEKGFPEAVTALGSRIAAADALLIATPEYNYSVPGVLKNAIDWLSRLPAGGPLKGKPAAIMGASRGMGGTIRSQLHLRQVALGIDMMVMPRPEVFVAVAQEKFDAGGELTDARTREAIARLLAALHAWTLRLAERP